MGKKIWKRCERHGKWFDSSRFSRCYTCNTGSRTGCVECGAANCNGICLDIALERARGIRDY